MEGGAMEWRAVVHDVFGKQYDVSDAGKVRKRGTGGISTYPSMHQRHPTVYLRSGSQEWRPQVRFLVAAAFIGPCPADHKPQHKDGNVNNNAAANLEYRPLTSVKPRRGERPRSRRYPPVDDERARRVLEARGTGTAVEVGRRLKVRAATVRAIWEGRTRQWLRD
jgi:hypothetical protein